MDVRTSPLRSSARGTELFTETNRMTPMDVTKRILAEYRDLPGLKLTTRQAARLWALELVQCEYLLNQLVTDGHLLIDARGQYAWTGSVHVRHVRPSEPRASQAVA